MSGLKLELISLLFTRDISRFGQFPPSIVNSTLLMHHILFRRGNILPTQPVLHNVAYNLLLNYAISLVSGYLRTVSPADC